MTLSVDELWVAADCFSRGRAPAADEPADGAQAYEKLAHFLDGLNQASGVRDNRRRAAMIPEWVRSHPLGKRGLKAFIKRNPFTDAVHLTGFPWHPRLIQVGSLRERYSTTLLSVAGDFLMGAKRGVRLGALPELPDETWFNIWYYTFSISVGGPPEAAKEMYPRLYGRDVEPVRPLLPPYLCRASRPRGNTEWIESRHSSATLETLMWLSRLRSSGVEGKALLAQVMFAAPGSEAERRAMRQYFG